MLYGLWSCGGHSQSATLLDRKWGDHASDYNGSGVITIAPVGHEPSIEVDPVAGFVFWVDKGIPGVQRANLDGTSPQTLVTLTSSPGGITVDPVTHTVYWSEQLAGTVSTIPYTGGVPNLLMSGLVELLVFIWKSLQAGCTSCKRDSRRLVGPRLPASVLPPCLALHPSKKCGMWRRSPFPSRRQ